MAESFSATFIGTDLPALTEAILAAVPYAKTPPDATSIRFVAKNPTADWRETLLAPDVDGLSMSWGEMTITRDAGMVTAAFTMAWQPTAVIAAFAGLPFELAKISATDSWTELDYKAPSVAGTRLGWAMLVKGDAHERYFVSRRWLAYGPFRTLQGPQDTTLVQFAESAEGAQSVAQAKVGHAWIQAGFLKDKHRFEHDIEGVRTKGDRLLRIVVNGREASDRELLDACAARRDDDAIDNIAYVFVSEDEVRADLERLWLRALECRYAGPSGEMRLDDAATPKIAKPSWT